MTQYSRSTTSISTSAGRRLKGFMAGGPCFRRGIMPAYVAHQWAQALSTLAIIPAGRHAWPHRRVAPHVGGRSSWPMMGHNSRHTMPVHRIGQCTWTMSNGCYVRRHNSASQTALCVLGCMSFTTLTTTTSPPEVQWMVHAHSSSELLSRTQHGAYYMYVEGGLNLTLLDINCACSPSATLATHWSRAVVRE